MPPRAKTVAVDRYVVEVLMRDLIGHDRTASAFVVYLFLWSRTLGGRAASARVSLQQLAHGTGLSKRGAQTAVKSLVARGLLAIERDTPTAVPEYFVKKTWA
ncbi:MAG: helix-turn-helix domain-containing protein [Proteobacteria bacterium]|nr:helix-turn-helix domain-containing protein [Pseudomonadota bacterium]